MQLDKFFDFLKDEKNLYSEWEQSNCFKPKRGGEPYSIMMPPPNVTGLSLIHISEPTRP